MFRINVESDSDDEMLEDMLRRARAEKTYKRRPNYLEELQDDDFFKRFRLSKQTVAALEEIIRDRIAFTSERNNGLSSMNQLLLTLRFFACGNMLITVGDFSGVYKSTASRVIEKVATAIAELHMDFIKFPDSAAEKQTIVANFFEIGNFPRVIGVIDCTHIKIQSPGGPNGENFRNRKGFFSLNVQCVADASMRIVDIVGRWPGSSHDQTIFDNSTIKQKFENGQFGQYVLLGDSGYGATRYLKTPIRNPVLPEEMLYQEAHILTRNLVERLFGVWKRRFPVLALGLRLKLETSQAIISACAVLHNIARELNEEEPPLDQDLAERVEVGIAEDNVIVNNDIDAVGIGNDDFIAYFTNLL